MGSETIRENIQFLADSARFYLWVANCSNKPEFVVLFAFCYDPKMREIILLLLHLLITLARLVKPGGVRSVIAESVTIKHQLVILNRSRQRSPNLRVSDRIIAGFCALLIHPGRLIRSAIVLKPSTLMRFHRALKDRKYRLLFSPKSRKKPGPKEPDHEVIAAVVEMRQRNPTWGCPCIAQQIALAFDIPINKDMWFGGFSPLTTNQNRTHLADPGSLPLVT
jgi:hypothetical protein